MARSVLVFGAGGFAWDVVDIAERVGGLEIAGCVVDRDPGDAPLAPQGLPVHRWPEVSGRASDFAAINGIGSPARRRFIEAAEARGFEFLTLIDPSAQIFPSARIGAGTVVGAGAIVAAAARIGRHVLVNRASSIGHHCEIGDFASCYAGVHVGGFTRVGAGAELGMGAVVVDRITIGERAFVAAGAVVIRDCVAESRVAGVPARPMAPKPEALR
jgi:sugar O-acyltransferase (sialic acid O-acetyltransferase NeuD family)